MAAYQPAKRQKGNVRSDNVEYFQGIDKIEYNNMASPSEISSYRYYNSSERLHSRTMEECLKFSISLTEFRQGSQYKSTRPWDDCTSSLDNHKRCIKALFELCHKLGVKYWTALDSDLAEDGWDDVVDYIQELAVKYHVKLLWIAPDLYGHPKYSSGALTSNDVTTFTQAASQIKRCLDISHKLNAECFLLWPLEGYHNIFQTDIQREIKLFAKLLKITAEYKDRLNFRCQLLIMPYIANGRYGRNGRNFEEGWQCEDKISRYMWDVTSCLYLLRSYNLERYYKVLVTPGHHMYMANVYNMLGGVTISNDVDHYDTRTLTLMMKCIVDQGITPPGGISLRLRPRGDSDVRECVTTYVKYIDSIAKSLRLACAVIGEQIISKHLQQRYSTYYSGFGSRVISSDVTIEECDDFYKKNQSTQSEASKHEHLDLVFQRHIDACEHI